MTTRPMQFTPEAENMHAVASEHDEEITHRDIEKRIENKEWKEIQKERARSELAERYEDWREDHGDDEKYAQD